ncbi:MAG: 6-bladed beta-propeller [Parabacteroides sp.]|nr:6-bladed beta-propeller [Parabacteroides sp.]
MKNSTLIFCRLMILPIFFFLSSCSTENSKKDFETITFKTEQASLKDSLDFKFIPLATNDDCLIGQISSIQLINDRLFIEDKYRSNALFVFDLQGHFITTIGKHGIGPNQYSRIFDFDIDRKGRKIAISDRDAGRILFYDLNDYHFLYAKKTSFSYQSFLFSNDGKIYFFILLSGKNKLKVLKSFIYGEFKRFPN